MAKIKNVEANYTRDLVNCANAYLSIVECAGGRPIVRGYICPHCRSTNPSKRCEGVVGFVEAADSAC